MATHPASTLPVMSANATARSVAGGARSLPHLRRLIDGNPLAYLISDPRLADNPIIACNDAFCMLTGYRRDEVLGRNCRFLSGPRTESWLSDTIRRGVHEHRSVLVEIVNYKRDGRPFRNAVIVAPVFGADDTLSFFLGSQIEIEPEMSACPISARTVALERIAILSPRQRQVLQHVARGRLNKQIAVDLALSEKTVKMHRALLMQRLGTGTVAEMVRVAVEAGM